MEDSTTAGGDCGEEGVSDGAEPVTAVVRALKRDVSIVERLAGVRLRAERGVKGGGGRREGDYARRTANQDAATWREGG